MTLKPTDVIKIFCDDLYGKSKVKILAVIAISTCKTKACCILINSSNYPDIHNNYFLKSQQLPVSSKKYPSVLTHDSFFDCSSIMERDIEEINAILHKEPKRLLGNIDSTDHLLITSALINNRTLPQKKKKLYGLN